MTKTVLVGDIGGTNVRFGLAGIKDGKLSIESFAKMPGDEFSGFSEALSHYASEHGIETAGVRSIFALAGPPSDGAVTLTNRDWTVSASQLQQAFGFRDVRLVNDFAAMARSIPEIDASKLEEIKPGTARPGAPIIVAGPGTGFGVATLIPIPDGRWHVIGGEGGYMAYAPQTEIEHALAARLQETHGYVFNELVCAGIGLEAVHRTLCKIFDREYHATTPGEMLTLAAQGDDMFRELCTIRAHGTMRTVGDLVLANGALGGVVLAGGVSEYLSDYLRTPGAIARFTDRGRNSHYLENCPIHLIRDPLAPLLGAAALSSKDA